MNAMRCPRSPIGEFHKLVVQTRTMDKDGTWEIWVCPECDYEKAVYVSKEEAKANG